MKKTVIFALLVMIMTACVGTRQGESVDGEYVVTVDSCEYISHSSYSAGVVTLTHKGNCKFCKERNEKTMRKIVREELNKYLDDVFD